MKKYKTITGFVILALILFQFFLTPETQATDLVMTEIMTNNKNSIKDGYGENSDWIEIHNFSLSTINLTGLSLTDDPTNLKKWTFPEQAEISPGAYLVIFASSKTKGNWIDPQGHFHTNFAISDNGEYLALVEPDGKTIIQDFSTPEDPMPKDISYGIENVKANIWSSKYFLEPSPGKENKGQTVRGFVRDTKFSKNRGIYSEEFNLEITSKTIGSSIIYTEDGSSPTINNGIKYEGPITINETKVIRAAAFKDEFIPTNVDTHTFIFLESVIKQPNTGPNLPKYWAGKLADYEMDPEIVNSLEYQDAIIPSLKALPSLSIAIKPDDFYGNPSGIYQNPKSEGSNWERPISVEFLSNNDDEEKFQIDSGMRIQGGSSRNPDIPKHSFSLRFRKEYGEGKLEYPLFKNSPHGESAAQEFDFLQLRGGFNFGWTHRHYYQSKHAQYNRDQFANDIYLAMGNTGVHGRWVHLYINGLYWGIYHVHERPDADYMESYFGESESGYDAINSSSATNGSMTNFNAMANFTAKRINSPQDFKILEKHLHVDSFIDYMLLNFYIGNRDWDGHNWRAAGNGPIGQPFRFFPWDSEFAISPNNAGATQNPNPINNALSTDVTNKNGNRRPTGIHQNLKKNNWYKLKFADRVRKHIFNGGPLSPEGARRIWQKRSSVLELPIIAESARWGDYRRDVDSGRWNRSQFDLYTRNDHYRTTQNWIFESYLPRRPQVLLSQLRTNDLYPSTKAPNFSQHGGQVNNNYLLEIENPNNRGTIFYTIDGSDPHVSSVESNETILVGENHPALILVQSSDSGFNLDWTKANFEDTAWQSGQTGIGFERSPGDYDEYINFSTISMLGKNASCLMRIEFTVPDQTILDRISKLVLSMKYDDGYAAFINGNFIAGKNNPEVLTWNSKATTSHPDSLALEFESVDISNSISSLRLGKNILAIQGMNSSRAGSDFLISPKLSYETRSQNGISANAKIYSSPVNLTFSGTVKARILKDNIWSALNEAKFIVGVPAQAGNLVISEIHYNPIGNSEENEFIELTNISNQIIELAGVKFIKGIRYEFKDDAKLKPMEKIVLSPELYEGQLNNGGERITLIDALGEVIESFKYDDNKSWFDSPDGEGPSLVRISPKSVLNPNLSTSWRPSSDNGGNPGTSDNTSFDGKNLISYALDSSSPEEIEITEEQITFKYHRNSLADDIVVIPQKSQDLKIWQNVDEYEVISQSITQNNTALITLKINKGNANNSQSMKYLRLKIETIN